MPYLLPETIEPNNYRCFVVRVPDDPNYLAAFFGQMNQLCYWWEWERDEAKQGKDAARVWRNVFESIGDCDSVGGGIVDCDEVRDCVDNQEPPPRNTPPENMTQNLAEYQQFVDGCGDIDKAIMFGFVTQMVDIVNFAVLDFFQRIELITNWLELVNEVLDDIPGIGSVPAILFDVVSFLQNTLAEIYIAAWDNEQRDIMRCDLFCLAVQNGCQLTLDDIVGYIDYELQVELKSNDIQTYLTWLISFGIAIPNRTAVLMGFGLVFWALSWASSFVGLGNAARFTRVMRALLNDPNEDWSILCDCVPAWCYKWSFVDGLYHGWTRRINTGLPDGGIFATLGIRSARQTINSRHSIWIESHTGAVLSMKTLEIEYSSPYPLTAVEIRDKNAVLVKQFIGGLPAGSQTRVITDIIFTQWDDYQIYIYSPNFKALTDYFYVRSVTLKGEGGLPLGLTQGEVC